MKRSLTVRLEDIREIDTWEEFDRYIETHFEDENGLKELQKYDEIILVQNTCDGRRYTLRKVDIADAIEIWEQFYKD